MPHLWALALNKENGGIMANYGIPYMGSKSKIADFVLSHIPAAENFYDLFGGGFSITHAAMLKNKWNSFHFNEIKGDVVELIKDSIAGKYNYEVFKPEFITREMFESRKNNCAYTRVIWSFANNQLHYLFCKDIEKRKGSLHNAVIHNIFDETAVDLLDFNCWPHDLFEIKARRLFIRKKVRDKLGLDATEQLQQLEQLERLQQLQQLERLEQLEQLQQLELTSLSYDEVVINQKSVVYCDIPYKGTRGYGSEFDHKTFYKWALTSKHPIFVSEYNMPDGFFEIASISKQQIVSSKNRREFVEKIFVNRPGLELLNKIDKNEELSPKQIGFRASEPRGRR